MSISERLDEIQTRADKATEGPWRSREVDDFHDEMPDAIEVLGPGPSTVTMVSTRDWDSEDDPEMVANAEFIAHARADVPRLVEALRRVLEACDELEANITYDNGNATANHAGRTIRRAIAAALREES